MCLKPLALPSGITVPCGKCLECCKRYSSEWAVRIMDEAAQYKANCFITLTYEKTGEDLVKEDFQKFLKRLRYYVGPFRYFLCGEYGGKGNRPHGHAIIFGWKPDDLKPLYISNGNQIYTSETLCKAWKGKNGEPFDSGNVAGFVSIGELTIDSARYCAKYLQKLDKRPHKVKPFLLMSRRPGIGACAVDTKFLSFSERYINGKSYPVPRYYINRLEGLGYNVDIIKARRKYIKEKTIDLDFGSKAWFERTEIHRKKVEEDFKNLLTNKK